jgi:hypothetical protein
MWMRAAQNARVQQSIPELDIIPKDSCAGYFFTRIEPGFTLTNWFDFLFTDYHY